MAGLETATVEATKAATKSIESGVGKVVGVCG